MCVAFDCHLTGLPTFLAGLRSEVDDETGPDGLRIVLQCTRLRAPQLEHLNAQQKAWPAERCRTSHG
jgi:hypothetical protein